MKYIRVDWPESQEWLENDACWQSEGCWGPSVFVPEELYEQVMEREEPTIPDESDPIWDEYVGMPEESKPWFMNNE